MVLRRGDPTRRVLRAGPCCAGTIHPFPGQDLGKVQTTSHTGNPTCWVGVCEPQPCPPGRPPWYARGHESPASSEVKAALGEHDVIASLRSERRRQANIQLVRFALGAVDRSVVPQRITRLDPLHQRAENGAQVYHVLDVEDFSSRLVHDLANVY